MYEPIEGTLVIGLGHKARHGKDQAARFIQRAFPNVDIQRFAFADALKAYCRVQHGMTKKDGRLLQRAGVGMRQADLEVWLRPVYWSIYERRPEIAIITDMRFPNEVAMVHEMGGFAVKVERRLADGELFAVADRDPFHESETALDAYDFDMVIDNPDRDLLQFEDNTLSVFRELTAGHTGVMFSEPIIEGWLSR